MAGNGGPGEAAEEAFSAATPRIEPVKIAATPTVIAIRKNKPCFVRMCLQPELTLGGRTDIQHRSGVVGC